VTGSSPVISDLDGNGYAEKQLVGEEDCFDQEERSCHGQNNKYGNHQQFVHGLASLVGLAIW
jgi:hypothetical protein